MFDYVTRLINERMPEMLQRSGSHSQYRPGRRKGRVVVRILPSDLPGRRLCRDANASAWDAT